MTNKTKSPYRLGELFCGAGGLALGAKNAKHPNAYFTHEWVTDIDGDSCNTILSNLKLKPEQVHCCSVDKLNFSNLRPVDGVVFGFPCNDFSIVGERKGLNGSFGGLFEYCVASLNELRPKFFVGENVGGLASSGGRRDLKVILTAFKNAGYQVHPNLFKFEEYGVPQCRHRLFFVGFREDLQVEYETPPPISSDWRVTCREALDDIPRDAPNHEFARQTSRVIERLRHIRPGENAFTADLPSHLKLKMNSEAKISQIYKRLKPDSPSYTVTGSGGGGTHMYHWAEPRSLTNRERARLQTFPDEFCFYGNRESVRKQIGMAVPPTGAKVIFEAILQSLVKHCV